jgi:hypothetical protein
MKASVALRASLLGFVLAGSQLGSVEALAAPTWGIDLNDASMQIDTDAYADNGVNRLRGQAGLPPPIWFEDMATADVNDTQMNGMASFFGQPPEAFDLVTGVNVFGTDSGFNPDFSTLASAAGVIGIKGLGTRTLDIFWRSTTANEQNGFLDEFYSNSMAALTAQIVATIDGVAPGTTLTISYDWEYNGLAVIDHEAGIEDPTSASGTLTFVDEQGNGPGNLFGVLFAEPGPLGGAVGNNGSYDLTTSNTADPSFLTIDLDSFARTRMDFPGQPPGGGAQHDQAGSTFNGRLTLTLPIPEPSCLALMLIGLLSLGQRSKRH